MFNIFHKNETKDDSEDTIKNEIYIPSKDKKPRNLLIAVNNLEKGL